jgi:GDP-4-dehydro-6-deoxy-D-mannose reductase
VVSQAAASFRVLVTGGNGFVGRHLVEALAGLGPQYDVVAGGEHVDATGGAPRFVSLDVTDVAQVRAVIAAEQPSHLVHLAAITAVPEAQRNLRRAWDVNFGGTLNIATALVDVVPQCRLIFCSSSEIYGASFRTGLPLDETALLDPLGVYGATKAAADLMIGQMARQDLRAIRVRPFSHTGPGQSESFVAAAFAAQIARIERGAQAPRMMVGNLKSRRDFLDVRDVVDFYLRAIVRFDEIPNGSAINVASGQSRTIEEILAILLSMSHKDIEVAVDPERLRSAETNTESVVGDAALARRLLGWQPRFDIRQTLQTVLDDFRARPLC